jgi:hypothetical protein
LPVVLQFRSVPPTLEILVRDAVESALSGDWTVTVSRSHLDGQWNLRLAGPGATLRIVLPAVEQLTVDRLALVLREVTATDDAREPLRTAPWTQPATDTL